MADFLKEQLNAIDARLRELRPLHEEYLKLQEARNALAGVTAPKRSTAGAGAPRRRRRRRRGGGTRADEALALLRQNPGLSVRELSERMNINHPNYLYRVLGQLEQEGAVKREGKGWAAA